MKSKNTSEPKLSPNPRYREAITPATILGEPNVGFLPAISSVPVTEKNHIGQYQFIQLSIQVVLTDKVTGKHRDDASRGDGGEAPDLSVVAG